MSELINKLTNQVLEGQGVNKTEALALWGEDLAELTAAADLIRRQRCGQKFDLCAILNGKSGRCSQDCRYCAQSSHYPTAIQEYPLLATEVILADAQKRAAEGIKRYAIVTSGPRLSRRELAKLCQSYRELHSQTGLLLCASLGLLEYEDFRLLREAGVSRYHNNLETSRNFFPQICTTHTYAAKIAAIKAAQKAGLTVCSGGIIGLGETAADRIDLALTLAELGIKSVPLNILNPIKGTPLENAAPLSYEEIRRTVAVFRFVLPDAALRLAGGRSQLKDQGQALWQGGANAAISGDMLTTGGIDTASDLKVLTKLGFEVAAYD